MIQIEVTSQSISQQVDLEPAYIDEDIVVIDNIKKFAEPDTVRMGMNAIVLCTAGKAQGIMNQNFLEILQNQLVILPPGVVCTDLMISPDFEFKALFLSDRILHNFLRDKISIWNDVVFVKRKHELTIKNENDMMFYSHYYELLRLYMNNKSDNPLTSEALLYLLRSAILAICGEIMKTFDVNDIPNNNYFQRFINLLGSGRVRHRSVESYATELCITPKYLSSICKRQSGKTANEWITERLVEEIRYSLQQTDLCIKEISCKLGFSNPSFFGRYVKDHTGFTPLQLRNETR